MSLDIAVLVSLGRHPVSGRARRADSDARAVEIALALGELYGARARLIHAGDPDEPALRDYLGMGVPDLTVLELPPEMDALPSLSAYLRELQPRLVLTGTCAERGWGSGQLPYALAERLGCPIATGIAGVKLGPGCAELCQALPHGRRRALRVVLPAVIGVSQVAPPPRQNAFARARRGVVLRTPVPTHMHIPAPVWSRKAARACPPRSRAASQSNAAKRLRAIHDASAGCGRLLENLNADEAARIILTELIDAGVLQQVDSAMATERPRPGPAVASKG